MSSADGRSAGPGPTRRELIRLAGFGLLAALPARAAEPAKFLVRSSRPQDLEPEISALDESFTPNDTFFIRSHFGPPSERIARDYRLAIVGGSSGHPHSLSIRDLEALPQLSLPAVLQCSGNGRALFGPKVPGAQWGKGAVGQALWSGPRLSEILRRVGIGAGSHHVQLLGADLPPMPTTPRILRSIPLERALAETTIVALRMNGQPLPHLHGGPARLVVPGWVGDHWVKWLREISLAPAEADGFYMKVAYRMPRTAVQPGQKVDPADEDPVQELPVKSLLTGPRDGARVQAGAELSLRGFAFAGLHGIRSVELSVDGGPWQTTQLEPLRSPGAWQRFSLAFAPKAGAHRVRSRATDSRGAVQPDVTPWNPGGYLWNGIDEITFSAA